MRLFSLCQGHRAHPGERHQRVLAGVQGEVLQGHGDRREEVRQHPEGGGRRCRLLLPVQPDLQLRDRHTRRPLHRWQRRWVPANDWHALYPDEGPERHVPTDCSVIDTHHNYRPVQTTEPSWYSAQRLAFVRQYCSPWNTTELVWGIIVALPCTKLKIRGKGLRYVRMAENDSRVW